MKIKFFTIALACLGFVVAHAQQLQNFRPYGNVLYLTTGGIKKLDVSQASPALVTLKTGNFYEGIHAVSDYVLYSDAGVLKKISGFKP